MYLRMTGLVDVHCEPPGTIMFTLDRSRDAEYLLLKRGTVMAHCAEQKKKKTCLMQRVHAFVRMQFDHHHVMCIPSSVGCLCWGKDRSHRLCLPRTRCCGRQSKRWMRLRLNSCYVIPVVLEIESKPQHSKNDRDVRLFPAKSCCGVIQPKDPNCASPIQSSDHISLSVFGLCVMKNNVQHAGSGCCYSIASLTQISRKSRPSGHQGEASTCQELFSSADGPWRLSSTILGNGQQKPLLYWIVSISSFSSCVHRVLTIFAIICLRGHGKWCLCPPLPFCIKLIFGTA